MATKDYDDKKTCIQRLTYRVRQATGLERTPDQILEALTDLGYEIISLSALRRLSEDPGSLAWFARSLT